jgi:hypothetical protein
MELLDRYLKAVGKYLPDAQRDDILKELSEDIRSEMEDKESELQRPLTKDEQEAILKQHGNPLVLASRYRQDHRTVAFGRQLIGPVLFPFYIKVLSFNLGLTFVILGAIFSALAISGQKISIREIIANCVLQLFLQLGAVTFIFSMIEKHLAKHPDRWTLKGLGGVNLELGIEKNIRLKIEGSSRQVSRFESVSIIVACVVALIWLAAVQSHPFLIFGPAALFLKLAPIWYQVYWPIALLTAAEIVRAAINLARPDWTRFRAIAQIAIQIGGLGVAYVLLRAGAWVGVADAAAGRTNNFSHAAEIVNQWIHIGLLITVFASGAQLIVRIVRLIRQSAHDATQETSAAA